MINSIDRFQQMEDPVMYLCNPDRRFLYAINGEDRHLTLRFNDLSELTFTVHRTPGTEKAYDKIETKRLIYLENVGWFQIGSATEDTSGEERYKSVTAQSHQCVFKDKGFVTEERVYMFYNQLDKYDDHYDPNDLTAIPSVVGQLNKQLGIEVALSDDENLTPSDDQKGWVITYIDPILFCPVKGSQTAQNESESETGDESETEVEEPKEIYRSFSASTDTNGYDFMINQVEDAFEVIFEFDYLTHQIKIKTLEDVTKLTNIYLSQENIVNSLSVTENADEIVTVMTCNGTDINISYVNPMGTNYIVDFSYYAKTETDEKNNTIYPWLSKELIEALDDWKIEFDKHIKPFSDLTVELQGEYVQKAEIDEKIQYANLMIMNLEEVSRQYGSSATLDGEKLTKGMIVTAETVDIDGNSLLERSSYYNYLFTKNTEITAYVDQFKPKLIETSTHHYYEFNPKEESEDKTGLVQSMIDAYNQAAGEDKNFDSYLYFQDAGDKRSYCKLNIASEVGVVKDDTGFVGANGTVELNGVIFTFKKVGSVVTVTTNSGSVTRDSKDDTYFNHNGCRYRYVLSGDDIISVYYFYVSGFDRYTTYMEIGGTGGWKDIWEKYVNGTLTIRKNQNTALIENTEAKMKVITDACNIKTFINNKSEELYDELSEYWIEGEYTNENIAAYDTTTMAERIDLANELMKAGQADLKKAAQPKFEMTVDAINFTRIYAFRQFTNELVLGRQITIEKEDGVYYTPALMTIDYDLDDANSFSMTFSNASRPGDTAMTFAELFKEASTTTKTVSSNWSNLTDYTRNKESITSLIDSPLDRSLRASNLALSSQSFVVDSNGILGRRYDPNDATNSTFDSRQLRIVNNQILFTSDSWASAALALGEISLEDGTTTYGLIANTLVGKLFLGEQMSIGDNDNLVTINSDGIQIAYNHINPDGTIEKITTFNADTSGNLTLTGTINANSGTIGGFTITDTAIHDGASLNDSNISLIANGKLTAKNVELTGNITATSGSIGGLLIEDNCLRYNTDQFVIDEDGQVAARNASVSGNITATSGTIAGLKIIGNTLNSEILSLDMDNGEISTNSITVTDSGHVTTLCVNEITSLYGTQSGLKFGGGYGQQNYYTLSFSSVVTDEGWKGVFTAGWRPGNVDITITANAALVQSRKINLKYTYTYNGSLPSYVHDTVTMSRGTNQVVAHAHNLEWFEDVYTDVKKLTGIEIINETSFGQYVTYVPAITCRGSILPETNNTYELGSGELKWKYIYLVDNFNGSDRKIKTEIKALSEDMAFDLIKRLTPKTYKFKDFNTPRMRAGFIAQEVEDVLKSMGMTTEDWAIVNKTEPDKEDNENNHYTLSYTGLIAPMVKVIQNLLIRIEKLEQNQLSDT